MARNTRKQNPRSRGGRPAPAPVAGTAALAPTAEAGTGASRRLIGMAVLKANFDANAQSYLDNFVPFALACIREMKERNVTAAAVREELKTEFGLDIPEHAVTSVLRRAARQGRIERSNNLFTLTEPAADSPSLVRGRDDLLRKHNALVDRLVAFAAERFKRTIKFEDAENALLAHMDEEGVPLALRFVSCPEPRQLRLVEDPSVEHIVLEFIEHITHADPVLFEYLEAVFQGSMLTSALYLPDPGSLKRRFTDTTVYFDTPLLLRVLGLAGPELEGPAAELVAMLQRQGAELACFQETVEELSGVLSAASHELQMGGKRRPSGPTDVVGHCVRAGIRSSDLRVIIEQLEMKLNDVGIHVRRRPVMERDLSVDENKLEMELQEAIRYPRPDAMRHDLEALTAVHRIRRGWRPVRIEECTAIFVTTNGSLVGVARRHFRHGGEFSWPLAIKDSDLATILWLKEPMAAPDLPRKRIIADCYGALRPSAELWAKYLDEVDRLSGNEFTDEDFAVLRYSIAAQQALTTITAGDLDAVTGDTVAQVLADAKAALVAPERRRLEAVTAQYEEEAAARARAEEEAEEERRRSAALESKQAKTAGELASTRAALDAMRQRDLATARHKATKRARIEANMVFWLGVAVTLAGAAMALVGGSLPPVLRVAGAVPAAVVVVLGALSLINGWHLGQGRSTFEAWRCKQLKERYVREVEAIAADTDVANAES